MTKPRKTLNTKTGKIHYVNNHLGEDATECLGARLLSHYEPTEEEVNCFLCIGQKGK